MASAKKILLSLLLCLAVLQFTVAQDTTAIEQSEED